MNAHKLFGSETVFKRMQIGAVLNVNSSQNMLAMKL